MISLAAAGAACTAISAASWIFSADLTWVEARILHAYCIWCVASFGILTFLLGVAVWGTLRVGENPS